MGYELRSSLVGLLVIWVVSPWVALGGLQIEPKWWWWFISTSGFLIPYLVAGAVLIGALVAGSRMKRRQDDPNSTTRL